MGWRGWIDDVQGGMDGLVYGIGLALTRNWSAKKGLTIG